eukprot:6205161-Pleurochrysis_carterae.AAC.2
MTDSGVVAGPAGCGAFAAQALERAADIAHWPCWYLRHAAHASDSARGPDKRRASPVLPLRAHRSPGHNG